MGRPDYEDSIAGGDDAPLTTEGGTTGWLQHGHDAEGVEYRDN